MNLHAPERQAGESQADYSARRKLSQAIVKQGLRPSTVCTTSSKGHVHRHFRPTGQSPKPLVLRKHKAKAAIKPTWPASADQKAQARPLIVLGKNRERDPLKREKPKSAVAKRMDRPSRTALMEAGHTKLMRFFGTV